MLPENHGHTSPSYAKPLVFRLNENGVGPEVVRDVLLDRGWDEFVEGESKDHEWNLWWRTNRFRLCDYSDLMPWQRLNHFPNTVAITKKDTLVRNMRRMRGVYGPSVYNFTPVGFNLPNDYTRFVAEYSKSQQEDGEEGKKTLWICKPADLSRGRGIFIFHDLSELTYDCSAVAQKYLMNPLLIGGYKFDLRIYVLVTSFHPLHIYMYQEGIVRFSTEKFDLTTLDNMFCHLTNTSINKLGPSYTTFKEGVGPGCKWSLTMLRNYFHQQGIDDEIIWQKICNIVTLTMLAQAPTVPKTSGCVELFGFDILIDSSLKPWLLEVNFSPALGLDCSIDHNIKRDLIGDIVDLMHFQVGDELRGGESFAKLKMRQAYSPNRKGSLVGTKRSFSTKPGPKRKSLNASTGSSPSRPSAPGSRDSLNRVLTRNRQPSNDRLAVTYKPSPRGDSTVGKASLKTIPNDKEDDYDEEIAAACKCSSSEADLKRDCPSSLSHQSGSVHGGCSPGKPNKTLNALVLPSLEESRKQLDSRRELIRSRQGQKQASPESPTRKPNLNSQGHSPTSLRTSKSGTTSSLSSAQSHPKSGVRGMHQYPNPADSSKRKQEPVQNNSRAAPRGKDASPKRSPSVTQPVVTRTGLKLRTKERPLSIMNQKGASNNRTSKTDLSFPAVAKLKPPQQVGDFVLTFPFNETTRRASFPSLDLRQVIRETQKQLRRAMLKGRTPKQLLQATSLVSTQRAPGGVSKPQLEEVTVQWAPLKSHHLLSGQC
ncbi:uncharacterized protein [Diadema antillarum]|uniref:uncharacterized protein n=1 Tax=Diadema antillarum TaxID=105358 RepID=UPI003A87C1C3